MRYAAGERLDQRTDMAREVGTCIYDRVEILIFQSGQAFVSVSENPTHAALEQIGAGPPAMEHRDAMSSAQGAFDDVPTEKSGSSDNKKPHRVMLRA